MKRALLLSLIIGVSGCTWPHFEGGGMDEVYVYARSDRAHTFVGKEFLGEDQQILKIEKRVLLAEKLDELKAHIAVIGMEIRPILPARVSMLEVQWGRAARTYAGNMLDDAMQDIAVLESMIRDLRKFQSNETPAKTGLST